LLKGRQTTNDDYISSLTELIINYVVLRWRSHTLRSCPTWWR